MKKRQVSILCVILVGFIIEDLKSKSKTKENASIICESFDLSSDGENPGTYMLFMPDFSSHKVSFQLQIVA